MYHHRGDYTVSLSTTDKDSGTSSAFSYPVHIVSSKKDLNGNVLVGGTPGTDVINVGAGSVIITILTANNPDPERYDFPDVTGSVIVYGYEGDDQIVSAANFTSPTEYFGGPGSDRLVAGGGERLVRRRWKRHACRRHKHYSARRRRGGRCSQDGGGTNTVIGGPGSNTFVPGGGHNSFQTRPGASPRRRF